MFYQCIIIIIDIINIIIIEYYGWSRNLRSHEKYQKSAENEFFGNISDFLIDVLKSVQILWKIQETCG